MQRTFIDPQQIESRLEQGRQADRSRIEEILAHAAQAKGLEPDEVAALLTLQDPELWQEVFGLAQRIKQEIYGRRIVLFAPLYVSNYCSNDCVYCAFRRSNKAERRALNTEQLAAEVRALEQMGHKRLLMVYGEHPRYGVEYIVETLRAAYAVKTAQPCGEIRRININAAPREVDEYRLLKQVGIGTYQIFQETYHPGRYAELHPAGTAKSDFAYRLYALHRAQEAGIDDVGVGALFGLYDWRFEVMGLLEHARDMERACGVGPHTVSFPRLMPAFNTPFAEQSPYLVADRDFMRAVAVIRLMVPYTGMILTAREKPELRHEMFSLGVSQIDGGSRIGVGSYQGATSDNIPQRQQFNIYDTRTLDEVVAELAELEYIPSFCTACYRSQRTGERFMALAKHGDVKQMCQPNALLTFQEYLSDYAAPRTRELGRALIERELAQLPQAERQRLSLKLDSIKAGDRDIYY